MRLYRSSSIKRRAFTRSPDAHQRTQNSYKSVPISYTKIQPPNAVVLISTTRCHNSGDNSGESSNSRIYDMHTMWHGFKPRFDLNTHAYYISCARCVNNFG